MSYLNRIFLSVIVLASVLSFQTLFAQNETAFKYKPGLGYLKSFGTDTYNYLKAPLKWKGDNVAIATFIVGSTLLIYSGDEAISSGIQQMKSVASKKISSIVEPLGRGYTVIGGTGALYVAGLISKNKKIQRASLQALKVEAIGSVIVGATKFVSQRARPNQNLGPYYWSPLKENDYHSFFSGHATYAFCAASMIAQYSKKKWVDVVVYTLATAVAFSRVHDFKHWPTDVIIGSAFGITLSHNIFINTNW